MKFMFTWEGNKKPFSSLNRISSGCIFETPPAMQFQVLKAIEVK